MDCLQTKLKGVVDNNNLPFFNVVKITVYPDENPSNNSFRINVYSAVKLKILGAGKFTNSQGDVLEDPKNLTVQSGSTQTVYYTRESEKYIILVYEPLKIKELNNGLPDYGPANTGVDSADLKQCVNAEKLGSKTWVYSTINVEDFAVCTQLTSLYIGYNSRNDNDHISGSLNKMVEGMIANGRTSGTISGKISHTQVPTTKINGHYTNGALYTLTIISSTEYTAEQSSETCHYVKSGDDWVLQE